MQTFSEISAGIQGSEDWAWARAPALMKPMEAAKADIEAVRSSHPFWSTWALMADFVKVCKSRFGADVTAEQFAKLAALEAAIAKMEAATKRVLMMHSCQKQ